MEDFELDYEVTAMPYMKASVDIPLKLLENNFKQVCNDLYEFSNNVTNGKLLITICNDENGICCFEANRCVENEDDPVEYDLEVTKTENGLKVIIFQLEEALIVNAEYNGLNYLVNLRE